MSVINAKPFIKTLIESLSDGDLATLRTMIDGGGSQTVLLRTTSTTFVNSERSRITTSDKGVHRCSLEVQGGLYTWNGYLIYNDSHCVLIYYSNDFQNLGWLKVKPGFQEIEYINEELSIIELRSELDDTAASEQAEIIEVVNEGISDGNILVPAYYETTNIASLSDTFINKLKSGDVVVKKTGNQRHSYRVSYKEKNQGICLTYTDAATAETVSYDYVDGHWVYNSTDVTNLGEAATYKPFKASWPTTGTTAAFCAAIDSDTSATIGNAYLGGASFSDLPFVGNGDIVVEVLEGPNNSKSIHLILTSGDVAPYRWEYTYWNNGSNVSGWIAYATKDYVDTAIYGAIDANY